MEKPKILIFDLETAPAIAYVWRFWKENISPKQVLEHGHIISFAAKWLGDDDIIYEENRTSDDKKLVGSICYLLDEADVVVAHNGSKFDIPSIYSRALVHGFSPPSPVKIIDTCSIARKEFNFERNSLEYLTMILDCNIKKGGHKKYPGFELWLGCLRGEEEAWKEMKEYNIIDVLALEELYLKMRPWTTNHPNVANYVNPESPTCTKCGSRNLQKRGKAYTNVGVYQRFQCMDCGGWSRGRYTESPKNTNLLANSV